MLDVEPRPFRWTKELFCQAIDAKCFLVRRVQADYSILNVVERQLEVHRDPVADATKPFGHSASPLAAPTASIVVADLLP